MEILYELMQRDIEDFRKLYLLGVNSAICWIGHCTETFTFIMAFSLKVKHYGLNSFEFLI